MRRGRKSVDERRKRLYKLVQEHDVLNTYQACRLLNRFGKDEFKRCYFTFKEKPMGSTGLGCRNVMDKKCGVHMTQVSYALKTMPRLHSTKMRFFDKGGIGSDLFRFFYASEKKFEKKILRQTLIPYIRRRMRKT